ncbi:MAG TPA: choice-of-anchor tandem repeat NxxGxxAF-containing protein, partial [Tepidisphaeraceae bacterium]|nr:choice-of-anchor tandem repeat NxxGxxAF-containing protein [Tepidisphaeraceae bacterium]
MHRTLAAAGITILLSASVTRADLPIRTVALSGQSAPGTSAPFLNFYHATINSAGRVAFTAQLDLGPPDSFEVGIWSEGSGTLANVARVNQNAPGTSDQFQDFLAGDEQLILDDAGNVAFPAYTTGSTTTPAGIWMGGAGSLQPYALQNSPAPGTSTTLAYPQAFVVNPAGTITFHARLNDPAIIREGIWTTLGGALHPIVIDGSPAP